MVGRARSARCIVAGRAGHAASRRPARVIPLTVEQVQQLATAMPDRYRPWCSRHWPSAWGGVPPVRTGRLSPRSSAHPLGHMYYGHQLFRRAVEEAGLPAGRPATTSGITSPLCCWRPVSEWSRSPGDSGTRTRRSSSRRTDICCLTARTGPGGRWRRPGKRPASRVPHMRRRAGCL